MRLDFLMKALPKPYPDNSKKAIPLVLYCVFVSDG